MTKIDHEHTESYPTKGGNALHLPLKDDPGRKGDPDHAESDAEMSDEMARRVRSSDGDTQIGDALRDIADNG